MIKCPDCGKQATLLVVNTGKPVDMAWGPTPDEVPLGPRCADCAARYTWRPHLTTRPLPGRYLVDHQHKVRIRGAPDNDGIVIDAECADGSGSKWGSR